MERRLLQERAADAPRRTYPHGTVEADAFRQLCRLGRTSEKPVNDIDGFRMRNYITDLGRLALRVCPVDEF